MIVHVSKRIEMSYLPGGGSEWMLQEGIQTEPRRPGSGLLNLRGSSRLFQVFVKPGELFMKNMLHGLFAAIAVRLGRQHDQPHCAAVPAYRCI